MKNLTKALITLNLEDDAEEGFDVGGFDVGGGAE